MRQSRLGRISARSRLCSTRAPAPTRRSGTGSTCSTRTSLISKALFAWCQKHETPLIYASSAAVYGGGSDFREEATDLRPLNVYGWSKLLFDQWLARHRERATRVVGLRYFNVYGPGEAHKGRMASVVHHFDRQLRDTGVVRLFGASHGVGDGEHRRDFVFVGDVVNVNLWAFDNASADGVYNVGTGASRSFNDLARAVIAEHGAGTIEYIPMPADLSPGLPGLHRGRHLAAKARRLCRASSCRSRKG